MIFQGQLCIVKWLMNGPHLGIVPHGLPHVEHAVGGQRQALHSRPVPDEATPEDIAHTVLSWTSNACASRLSGQEPALSAA